MTDELLYAKLARHTAETGSPLPVLHGDHVGFLGVVYPLVLSPFYGAFDAPGAFDATHIVNAVLFASAAIPAYLLARRLAGTPCALVVSLLSVAVPWCVNAAFVMSEAAAYPVFLWAMLACHAAVSEPSAAPGRPCARSPGARVLHEAAVPHPRRGPAPRGADRGRPTRRLAAASAARGRLRGGDPRRRPARRARREPPAARRLRGDGDAGIAAPRRSPGSPPRSTSTCSPSVSASCRSSSAQAGRTRGSATQTGGGVRSPCSPGCHCRCSRSRRPRTTCASEVRASCATATCSTWRRSSCWRPRSA